MKADYLICYDITCPKRWGKVYRYLLKQGRHIQFSVFRCSLAWKQLQELKRELSECIKDDEDDVRIYPLPANRALVAELGRGDRIPEGVEVYME